MDCVRRVSGGCAAQRSSAMSAERRSARGSKRSGIVAPITIWTALRLRPVFYTAEDGHSGVVEMLVMLLAPLPQPFARERLVVNPIVRHRGPSPLRAR